MSAISWSSSESDSSSTVSGSCVVPVGVGWEVTGAGFETGCAFGCPGVLGEFVGVREGCGSAAEDCGTCGGSCSVFSACGGGGLIETSVLSLAILSLRKSLRVPFLLLLLVR